MHKGGRDGPAKSKKNAMPLKFSLYLVETFGF
jgi:hypothetical protein